MHSTPRCEARRRHFQAREGIAATFWSFVPLLFGLFAAQPGSTGQTVTRLVVQDEMILRVPVQPHPMTNPIDWIEHKGPKCLAAGLIRRAVLSGTDQVDFILADRSRVRAKFADNCPALDFYRGFYLQPEDERLCAGRDAIFSRIGGSCTIRKFRQLEPAPPR